MAEKVGINFPHGIPGRPNTVPNTNPSPGPRYQSSRGGRGARGGSRGGRVQKAGTMEVKKKSSDDDDECAICDRPKVEVYCLACGWTRTNMRIKKVCEMHPKRNFVHDLNCCPECKTENLEEESG